MVIGTILALIFAGGALWNSISRRRILNQSALAEEKEERIFFKPIPSSAASQQEKPENASPEGPLPPLFRQIGSSGVLSSEESADEEEDLYVWE